MVKARKLKKAFLTRIQWEVHVELYGVCPNCNTQNCIRRDEFGWRCYECGGEFENEHMEKAFGCPPDFVEKKEEEVHDGP